ncbi:terminase large subunit [Methylobacterium isbiliense]|nr:terminase TerL endonuclease subunit [Methylobacterium isbiliense]MDN3627875.1 terminase large subunit [Methylobacterium isbiliense]
MAALQRANARKAGVFKTKHLNIWVQARDAYFNVQRWIESAVPDLSLDDFRGQPCRLGLDLASKVDIAAGELLFELARCTAPVAQQLQARGYHYARFGFYWLPEAAIEAGESEHYRGWRDADPSWLIQTDGDMIDHFAILDTILGEEGADGSRTGGLVTEFQLEEVAYDPHQATMLVTALQEAGLPCVEVRPLVLNFSEPMKQMDALIRSRAIAHSGDPVFTWMLSNVVAKPDRKDNVYPTKLRPENKIDGPVAHLMALARCMSGAEPGIARGFVEL